MVAPLSHFFSCCKLLTVAQPIDDKPSQRAVVRLSVLRLVKAVSETWKFY